MAPPGLPHPLLPYAEAGCPPSGRHTPRASSRTARARAALRWILEMGVVFMALPSDVVGVRQAAPSSPALKRALSAAAQHGSQRTSTRGTIALLTAALTLSLTALFGVTTDLADQADGQTYGEVVAGRRSP